jgi:hypothetical protein
MLSSQIERDRETDSDNKKWAPSSLTRPYKDETRRSCIPVEPIKNQSIRGRSSDISRSVPRCLW